jgi:predicted metal-dependent peptidase
LYDFKSITDNTIDMKKGEIFKVLEKCDKKNDSEWWLVQYDKTMSVGYVPKNYVKLLV